MCVFLVVSPSNMSICSPGNKQNIKWNLKRGGVKTDYLGGLAELLTVLLLHLHQPGVALQHEGRGRGGV